MRQNLIYHVEITDVPNPLGAKVIPNPPAGSPYDYIIEIPKQVFDGEQYMGIDGSPHDTTFERNFSHELYHIYELELGLDANEALAEAFANEALKNSEVANQGDSSFLDSSAGGAAFNDISPNAGDNANDTDGDGRANPPPPPPPEDPNNPGDPGDPGRINIPKNPWLPDFLLSPLVLDLDDDGVELYSVGDYGTYFDLNGDGQATLTGWVEPDDGLLALDINQDGMINNITELFGSGTTDGFSILATYDSNADNKIDSSDVIFSDLLVWTDTNSDGVSQADELHTLTDLNIISISLNVTRLPNVDNAGNSITHESSYETSDNATHTIVDAWFDDNPFLTVNAEAYDLDIRATYLPDLKGYGQLKDLYIATSIDNSTDPDSLMEQLTLFASTLTLEDALADWDSVEADVQDLLYRWADIENVDPQGRGENVNGQHLAFYEAIRGEEFNQYGYSDPHHYAGIFVDSIYDYMLTYYTAQLVGQIAADSIFTSANYNLYHASIKGDLTLLQSGIDAIESQAISAADAVEIWTHFAQLLGYTKGLDNLTASEITALDAAVAATNDPAISNWANVVSSMELSLGELTESAADWANFDDSASYNHEIHGTVNADTITDAYTGSDNDNLFYGHEDNDVIYALDGNDKIDAGAGNDTLVGGTGDDIMIGGTGDDIYIYTSGNDTISEEGGAGYDVIHVEAATGFTQADLTLYRQGDNLNLLFSDGSFIVIDGYSTADGSVEKILFDFDTTEIDLTALTSETFYGTAGFDDFTASGTSIQTLLVYGFAGNDVLEVSGGIGEVYGGDGYDVLIGDYLDDELYGDNQGDYLFGNAGNDLLNGGDGNDVLDGGAGDDILYGGSDNDTFRFGQGYGNDYIERTTVEITSELNHDTIDLFDVLPSEIEIYRDDTPDGRTDLVFKIIATGDELTIEDMYAKNGFWTAGIENVEFSDGTVWTHESIMETYIALNTTSGDDVTLGFEADDVFLSSAGNDVLHGYSGDDIYHWGAGAGNDVIEELTLNLNNGNTADKVIFDGLNVADLTFQASGDDLLITNIITLETLTINNQFHSLSYYHIDSFEFADSTILGEAAIDTLAHPSSSGEISGTIGNDTIYGDVEGVADDTINGLAGDDIIYGYAGNDSYVWAVGDENDTIYDTNGVDQLILHGVLASEITFEKSGNYDLKVHIGSETIILDNQLKSDYTSTSNYDDDQIETALLDDSSVIDLLNNLTFVGTSGGETLTGLKNGNDILIGLGGDDTLHGYKGDDSFVWSVGDGSDTIYDTEGVDQLVLHGVLASEITFGKNGNYDLELHIGSETIILDNQLKSDYTSTSNYDDDQIETLLLDDSSVIDLLNNLTFTGTSSGETLTGLTNGNDTLVGLGGDDTLRGYKGDDNYIWSVGDGSDTIYDTEGVDQLVLHGVLASEITFEKIGNYDLKIHIGSESILLDNQLKSDYTGSSTYDKYQIETLLLDDSSVIDLLNNLTFTGTSSGETVNGLKNGHDTLYALDGNDTLYSYAGDDTLVGGTGDDTLRGELGNDNYIWSVGDGDDTIYDTGGIDQLVLHGVLANEVRLEKSGVYDLEIHIGSETIMLDNQLRSDYTSNATYDKYQIETILLDNGTVIDIADNLTFNGTSGDDTLTGSNGDDTLLGFDGNDVLNGDDGHDTLIGGNGSDYLYGNNGDDILSGGAGIDMLYGQAGADTFVFEAASAFTNSDNVQDFDLSDGDKLDISDLLIGYDPLTDAISDFVQITESGSNSYLSVDADGGADNFVQVAYLYNETGLTDENALETSGNLITV